MILAASVAGVGQAQTRIIDYRGVTAGARVIAVSANPVWRSIAHDAATAKLLVNVHDAIKLANGNGVLVATSRDLNLLLFDSSGRFARVVGRQGGGPGEFQTRLSLFRGRGDSVLAVDGVGRVTVFRSDGGLARSYQLTDTFPRWSIPQVAGVGPDGTLFGYVRHSATPRRTMAAANASIAAGQATIYRDSIRLLHFTAAGIADRVSSPILAPSRAVSVTRTQGGAFVNYPVYPSRVLRDRPVVVGNGVLYVQRDVESEVGIYLPAGGLRALVRFQATQGNVDDVRGRAYTRSQVTEMGFLSDDLGNLWYQVENTAGADNKWLVLAGDGSLVGTALTPGSVRVLRVAQDYLVGVRVTEDHDVVEVYALRR
jgi:hypothetical protein